MKFGKVIKLLILLVFISVPLFAQDGKITDDSADYIAWFRDTYKPFQAVVNGSTVEQLTNLLQAQMDYLNKTHPYLPGLNPEKNFTKAEDFVKEPRFMNDVFGNLYGEVFGSIVNSKEELADRIKAELMFIDDGDHCFKTMIILDAVLNKMHPQDHRAQKAKKFIDSLFDYTKTDEDMKQELGKYLNTKPLSLSELISKFIEGLVIDTEQKDVDFLFNDGIYDYIKDKPEHKYDLVLLSALLVYNQQRQKVILGYCNFTLLKTTLEKAGLMSAFEAGKPLKEEELKLLINEKIETLKIDPTKILK